MDNKVYILKNKFIDKKYIDSLTDNSIKIIIEAFIKTSFDNSFIDTYSIKDLLLKKIKTDESYSLPYVDSFISICKKIINKYTSNSVVVCVGNSPAKIIRFQEMIMNEYPDLVNVQFIFLPISGVTGLVEWDDLQDSGYSDATFDKLKLLMGFHGLSYENITSNLEKGIKDYYLVDYKHRGKTLWLLDEYFKGYNRMYGKRISSAVNLSPLQMMAQQMKFDKLINAQMITINYDYDKGDNYIPMEYDDEERLAHVLGNEEDKSRCIKTNRIDTWDQNTSIFNSPMQTCNIVLIFVYLYMYQKDRLIGLLNIVDLRTIDTEEALKNIKNKIKYGYVHKIKYLENGNIKNKHGIFYYFYSDHESKNKYGDPFLQKIFFLTEDYSNMNKSQYDVIRGKTMIIYPIETIIINNILNVNEVAKERQINIINLVEGNRYKFTIKNSRRKENTIVGEYSGQGYSVIYILVDNVAQIENLTKKYLAINNNNLVQVELLKKYKFAQ